MDMPTRNLSKLVVIIMLYFMAFVHMDNSLNVIALYVVLPCAFIITLTSSNMPFKVSRSFNILIILYLWVMFSMLFSSNLAISSGHITQMMGCVLLSYIIGVQAKDEKIIPWLYIVYAIIYAVSIHYVVTNILPMMYIGEERVTDERLNGNKLAYYTFYTTFVVFIFGEILQKKYIRKVCRCLFFCIIPLSLWVAYITASRQILVLQIPLIVILLFLRYWKYGKTTSKILITVFLCCAIPIVYSYITPIFEDSLLAERSEDIEDDARLLLIHETIDIGLNNPLVGVGTGCVRLYTTERSFAHNTFLELFAGTGVIGMLIFIGLLWDFLSTQIKRYMATHDKMYMYFLIFGVFFIIDQTFYVFYYAAYLISFMILVASHSDTYYRNHQLLLNGESRI